MKHHFFLKKVLPFLLTLPAMLQPALAWENNWGDNYNYNRSWNNQNYYHHQPMLESIEYNGRIIRTGIRPRTDICSLVRQILGHCDGYIGFDESRRTHIFRNYPHQQYYQNNQWGNHQWQNPGWNNNYHWQHTPSWIACRHSAGKHLHHGTRRHGKPPAPRGAGCSGTHRVRNAVLGLGCRCSASLPAARLLDHRRGGGGTRELGAQHPVPGCEAREGRVRKRTPGGPALPLRAHFHHQAPVQVAGVYFFII